MLVQTGLPLAPVLEADDSRTAAALCEESELDLVFCDLNMTRTVSKNGIEILRDIRKIRPGVPIFMVTGEGDDDVVKAICAAGATGHLLKPMNLRTLKRVLAATFYSSTSESAV